MHDPKRCAAELQECGELERACMTLVQQAFSLVLTAPGGVSLSFAGLIEHVGREVAWPQVWLSYESVSDSNNCTPSQKFQAR